VIGLTAATTGLMASYELRPIGCVESSLVERERAPKQGFEGAPDAWLVFAAEVADALRDLAVGDEIWVLTWLDRAQRNPETGVFSTRSQDRPNPIGLHRVRVVSLDGLRVRVSDLEALDGTPILDIKPVLAGGR